MASMTQYQKLILARKLVITSLAIAWLTPVLVAFLPWSICEPVINDFGITNISPMLKYWFVMAASVSGMIGCIFIYLLFDTKGKLRIMTATGIYHIFLGVVLLTRGLGFLADRLVVIWDSSFCIIVGIVIILLANIKRTYTE